LSDDAKKIDELSEGLNGLKIAFEYAVGIQTALDANKLGWQF
jgi:hypothetical protein